MIQSTECITGQKGTEDHCFSIVRLLLFYWGRTEVTFFSGMCTQKHGQKLRDTDEEFLKKPCHLYTNP